MGNGTLCTVPYCHHTAHGTLFCHAAPQPTPLMEERLIGLLKEMGLVDGMLTAFAVISIQQFYKHRERLTGAWITLISRVTELIVENIRKHTERYVEQVSAQVANIYTFMYMLLEMAPIRVMVIKFVHRKEGYLIRVEHEAVMGLTPIKPLFQNIRTGEQLTGHVNGLKEQPMGEHILHSIDELEDGDYKDLLESVDVKGLVTAMIGRNKRVTWVLSVHFNRENPVNPAYMARIRIVTANIGKIIAI